MYREADKPDVSAGPLVTVMKGLDYGMYQLAEHYATIKISGAWKNYTYDEDAGDKAGKHPSSFRNYIRDLTSVGRAVGCNASEGKILELVAQYDWMTVLGFDIRTMALIGYEALRDLREQHGKKSPADARVEIENVLAEFEQTGKMYTPSNKPAGVPRFALRVAEDGPDYHRMKALVITQDGVPYTNKWPKRLTHYLSKRLRAAIEELDQ
jgi:hypothetical protein